MLRCPQADGNERERVVHLIADADFEDLELAVGPCAGRHALAQQVGSKGAQRHPSSRQGSPNCNPTASGHSGLRVGLFLAGIVN